MSIKSDKWIRRMSEEHGMIDPFEPNQIKEAESHGDDAASLAFASQILMAEALSALLQELVSLLGGWQE